MGRTGSQTSRGLLCRRVERLPDGALQKIRAVSRRRRAEMRGRTKGMLAILGHAPPFTPVIHHGPDRPSDYKL